MLLLPVDASINLGQTTIVLMALIIIDVVALRESRWSGVLTGVAAGIKVVPGVFIIYFIARRQWRSAVIAMLSAAATFAVGAIILPRASMDYWTNQLFTVSRVANPEWLPNESFLGTLARALHSPSNAALPALILGVASLAAAVWIAHNNRHDPDPAPSWMAFALVLLLAPPVSWHQNWVWVVPLTIAAVGFARTRRLLPTVISSFALLGIVASRANSWLTTFDDDALGLSPVQNLTTGVVTLVSTLILISLTLSTLRPGARATRSPELPPSAKRGT